MEASGWGRACSPDPSPSASARPLHAPRLPPCAGPAPKGQRAAAGASWVLATPGYKGLGQEGSFHRESGQAGFSPGLLFVREASPGTFSAGPATPPPPLSGPECAPTRCAGMRHTHPPHLMATPLRTWCLLWQLSSAGSLGEAHSSYYLQDPRGPSCQESQEGPRVPGACPDPYLSPPSQGQGGTGPTAVRVRKKGRSRTIANS